MKELKNLTQLQHLNFSNTKITDAGLNELEDLKDLTQLQHLDLRGNYITDAQLQEQTNWF